MQHPNITAYRSIDDLKLLKKWFYLYNDNIDNRLKAVQKVKGLATRGKLPHGVEATSFLTTMVLNDNEHGSIDSNTLQLSYTMALIRFVNGLLDPFQQSNYAIPMHLLAKQLNLPTYFVELRHMGTHESLPSLDILRITCANALKWLLENFWNNIDDLDEGLGSTSKDPLREALNLRIQDIETKLEKYQVYNNLKTFKKIRKQDLDKVYELENEEDNVAIKYNRCVADIMTLASEDSELLFDILFFKDYLIYPSIKVKEKKSKFNPLIVKLYRPLLDKLGIDCKLQCFNKIINIIENKPRDPIETRLFKKLAFSELSHPDETIQLVEWLLYFGQELSKSDTIPKEFENKDSLISKILDELESIEKQVPESIFSSFTNVLDNLLEAISKEEISQSLVERLGNWIKSIKNLQATKNTYELPPSLDDLLGFDPSPTSKRTLDDKSNHESDFKKQRPSNNNEIFLLTSHNNWKPTPFGSCV